MNSNQAQEIKFKREVKSFVRRSRMTPSQKIGMQEFWSLYGIENSENLIDLEAVFQRNAPTILEIGFGMGASLLKLAETNPHINFLGIEVHRPGVGALLANIHDKQLTNIRVFCADAHGIIAKCIPNQSLMGVLLFFPDPWPKRRHHKRRIVQTPFVDLVHQKLSSNGYFHLATDVGSYAEHMLEIMDSHEGFTILNPQEYLSSSLKRPTTKFGLKGEVRGHKITDLIYIKNSG